MVALKNFDDKTIYDIPLYGVISFCQEGLYFTNIVPVSVFKEPFKSYAFNKRAIKFTKTYDTEREMDLCHDIFIHHLERYLYDDD